MRQGLTSKLIRDTREAPRAEYRHLQKQRRAEKQPPSWNGPCKERGRRRAEDRADRRAGRDEAEQALALFGGKNINDGLPEDRNYEKIEDLKPN